MGLKGNSANLSAVRGTDAQTRSIFFDERNNNNNTDDGNKNEYDDVTSSSQSPPPLLMESSVLVSLMMVDVDVDADGYNGENENEKNICNNNNNNTLVRGEIFVTNTQVLFVAIERDQSHYDLAIVAACIVLHAMTDEPELSLYLQLSSSNSDQEGGGGGGQQQEEPPPTEVTFTPIHNNNDNDCQKIFDALCKLVSLHPIEPDDDDDGNKNNEQGKGMFGFGGGVSFGDDGGDFDNDDDDDDGFIWAPATSASNTMTMASTSGTNGTPSERDVMLERLDNLLSVRPEFEINDNEDGQFDDAIEDNDFNNNINEQEN